MADNNFNFVAGIDADVTAAKRTVTIFKKDLLDKGFKLNLLIPNIDTKSAQLALNALMKAGTDFNSVSIKTQQMLTSEGKLIEQAVGISAKYKDGLYGMASAHKVVQSSFTGLSKNIADYDRMGKYAQDSANKAKNMGEAHKTAIQGTASQLITAIESWKKLAAVGEGNSKTAQKLKKDIIDLNNTLRGHVGAATTAANSMQNWTVRISNAIKQTFAYGLALRGLRVAQQEVGKAIQYVIDLNTEMIRIQVLQTEGAKSASEINLLADSFNKLAQEMGVATLEVAKGSLEWLRQGKTIEETGTLLKATMMMSKLGNMSAAMSTEHLTSTINGYGLAASEATSIVDKLVAVDNVAATSVDELSTAMQYSAAIANQTGVSLEQLVSYIGTVSETTRQNAESIGQGMKTMLTRMQDIKAGKIDEDGIGINNVEIALDKANIKLRDSQDSFRDFGTVLEELGGKWGTLTETEQAFIAKSIAGIRQVNMFTVLMNNMDRALELQKVQMDASGLAADRYKIYMQSLEAKLAKFKATLQGLYQDAISSNFVATLVDWGTSMLKAVDSAGGLIPLLEKILALTIAIKVAQNAGNISTWWKSFETAGHAVGSLNKGFTIETIKGVIKYKDSLNQYTTAAKALTTTAIPATGAVTGLSAAIKVGIAGISATISSVAPYLLLAAAVIIAVKSISDAIVTQAEAWRALENAQDEQRQANKSLADAKALQKKYTDLNDIIGDSTKTAEGQADAEKKLVDVKNQLAEMFPNLIVQWDLEGNAIGITTGAIRDQITALEDLADAKAIDAKVKAEDFLYKDVYNPSNVTTNKNWNALGLSIPNPFSGINFNPMTTRAPDTGELENRYSKWQNSSVAFGRQEASKADVDKAKLDYDNLLNQYKIAMLAMGVEGAKEFVARLDLDLEGVLFNTLLSFATDIAKVEAEALKSGPDYNTVAMYERRGYSEEQSKNAVAHGTGSDLNEYLFLEKLPQATKQLEEYDKAKAKIAENEIITKEELDAVTAIGLKYELLGDGTQKLTDMQGGAISSREQVVRMLVDEIDKNDKLNSVQKQTLETQLLQESVSEDTKSAYEELASTVDLLSSAYEEQQSNGELSIDTAMGLIDAGMEEAVMYDENTGKLMLNQGAMINLQKAKILMAIADQRLISTTKGFTQAQVDAARAMIAAYQGIYNALDESNPVANLGAIGSGGSSGAKQEDPRIKENEQIIEQLEDQIDLEEDKIDGIKKEIDVIKEAQDQYNDWIGQKKKSLELDKEESDYYKEQQKSLKDLARVKKGIATLELDNSEEARAKRLALEEQAAQMEGDIADSAEDRRYDLQMQALDNLKDAFDRITEEQIKAKEEIIDGIELVIEGIRDQIDVIKDFISELKESGSGSGGTGGDGGNQRGSGSMTRTIGNAPNAQNATTVVLGEDAENLGIVASAITNGVLINDPGNMSGTHRKLPNAFDMLAPAGSGSEVAIQSMMDGIVVRNGWDDNLGNVVEVLDETTKTLTRYAHLRDLPTNISLGQNISAGQSLGIMGRTGEAAGGTDHLHAEVFSEITDEAVAMLKAGTTAGLASLQQGKDYIYTDLQGDLLDSYATATGDFDGVFTDVSKSMTGSMSDLKTAVKDDMVTLEEARDLGIIKEGDILDGFSVTLDGILTNFKFDNKSQTYVEQPPLIPIPTSGSEVTNYFGNPPTIQPPGEQAYPVGVGPAHPKDWKPPAGTTYPPGSAEANISGALPERDDPYPAGETPFFEKAQDFASKIINDMEDGAAVIVNDMQDGSAKIVNRMQDGAAIIVNDMQDSSANIVNDMQDGSAVVVSGMQDGAANIINNMQDGAANVVNSLMDGAAGVVGIMVGGITSILNGGPEQGESPYPPAPNIPAPKPLIGRGSGKGMVAMTKHSGGFAGDLQSNEVFAKLLKGEYVATEGQMNNFMKNVLPTIAMNMPKTYQTNGAPSISVNMPINVEGNMDKTVIPDIKRVANQVIGEINKSLVARGYVRPSNQTVS